MNNYDDWKLSPPPAGKFDDYDRVQLLEYLHMTEEEGKGLYDEDLVEACLEEDETDRVYHPGW